MQFHSLGYLAFLALVLVGFAWTRASLRAGYLLVASLAFCAWLLSPPILAAAGLMIAIGHYAALFIADAQTQERRQAGLLAAVTASVAILLGVRIAAGLAQNPGTHPLVTVGLSFLVLQVISYPVDVYLGIVEPRRRLDHVVLYLTFFPKFIQGPIERSGSMFAQIDGLGSIDASNLKAGMQRFAWGLFKKTVVADRLAVYVDHAYGNVQGQGGLVLVLATYVFGLQLYFDFSGYTDMALGTARMLGIRLTENFDRPYLATSTADFWRRWHISLSRWLLDYVFKPLQIHWRGSRLATPLALFLTFTLSGVWHGTTWNFVAWGLLHGTFLASAILMAPWTRRVQEALHLRGTRTLRWWETFATLQLVTFAWIPFRSGTIAEAWYVVTHLGTGMRGLRDFVLVQGQREAMVTVVVLMLLAVGALVRRWIPSLGASLRARYPSSWQWAQGYLLVLSILALGRFSSQSFIYAKF